MNIATKPMKLDELKEIVNHYIQSNDLNYAGITLIMGKATRIGDVLHTITVDDVYDQAGNVRDAITYIEEKTSKKRIITVSGSPTLRKVLESLYAFHNYPRRDCNLFYSRKHENYTKPISITHVNRKLKEVAESLGLVIDQISTHAIRKTGARAMFESGVPIEVIGDVLNHSDTKTTRIYICCNSKDVEKAMEVLAF